MIWPFSMLKRKDPRINHDLDHDDQQAGADATKAKADLRKLKMELEMRKVELEAERDRIKLETEIEEYTQRLEDLQGDDELEPAEGGDPMEKMLMGIIGASMASKAPTAPQTGAILTPVSQSQPPEGEPSNEELRTIWNKLPKQYQEQALQMAK